MEETTQKQKEISLTDILKLLLGKIKLLILVVLCGVVVGAGFGVLTTYNVKYYGSTMEFYVNPRLDKDSVVDGESEYGVYGAYGTHVMEGLIDLLSSELFAENLMLGANGLPENVEAFGNAELTAKVNDAAAAQTEAESLVKAADDANTALTEANTDYKETSATLTTLWTTYRSLHASADLSLTPSKFESANLTTAQKEINEAYDANETAKAAFEEAQTVAEAANDAAETALEDSEDKTEEALELWRQTDENYYKKLDKIVESVSYSYYDQSKNVSSSNISRSFVFVEINVLNDEAYAKVLRDKIEAFVPEFIEENMPIPAGYDSTNCQRISRRDAIERTNENIVLTTAAKYGVLLAAVALIVACVVVVIVDRSDKRVRNIDQVTELFNVPVLGVIPTIKPIEKENQENATEVTK